MGTVWFCITALTLTIYVLLDGFVLGAGIVHLLVARTDAERRMVLGSIGPVREGNEVWLIAAGGMLFCAFPLLYASGFSGFYLPLMIVLWLLILRGISIEFRGHIKSAVWDPLWDFLFCCSSLLLAVFYGAALANVVRGVPLDATQYFFEPLWTNFQLGDETGILDWYTILVGVLALAAIAMHGALWVHMKTGGAVNQRTGKFAAAVWWIVAALTAVVTTVTFRIQPQIETNFADHHWGALFPVLAVAGLTGVIFEIRKNHELRALCASGVYLGGMMTSVVFGVYPMVLPARHPRYSLTVENAQAGEYGLSVGLIWWILGILLASTYFIFVYRSFSGKVTMPPAETSRRK